MKLHNVEIPAIMAHLPRDERGYPIPYFVPIVNGAPDSRYQDAKKKQTCRTFLKCSVCGSRLFAKSFWFIQGPNGLKNSISSDEAMHEECARFSLAHCPHLFYQKAERRSDADHVNQIATMLRNKHERIYLIKADKVYFVDHVHTRFRSVLVFPFKYEDNRLTPA